MDSRGKRLQATLQNFERLFFSDRSPMVIHHNDLCQHFFLRCDVILEFVVQTTDAQASTATSCAGLSEIFGHFI
jgi:hypothetical protein